MSTDPPNAPTDLKFKPTTIVYVRSVDASRPDRQCYDYFGTTNSNPPALHPLANQEAEGWHCLSASDSDSEHAKERVLARAKQIFGDNIIISYGGCK